METGVYQRILDSFLQELAQKLDDGARLVAELQQLRENGHLGREQMLVSAYARLVDDQQ